MLLTFKGLSRLERCTRYWPMVISETLLCNMMQVTSKKKVSEFYVPLWMNLLFTLTVASGEHFGSIFEDFLWVSPLLTNQKPS